MFSIMKKRLMEKVADMWCSLKMFKIILLKFMILDQKKPQYISKNLKSYKQCVRCDHIYLSKSLKKMIRYNLLTKFFIKDNLLIISNPTHTKKLKI